jgi:pilus assembly protein CpaC
VTPELVRPIPAGQPGPELKFTTPFLKPNTGKDMGTPGLNATGPVPVKPPERAIPVEKLIQSMQPAQPQTALPAAAPAASPPTPHQ